MLFGYCMSGVGGLVGVDFIWVMLFGVFDVIIKCVVFFVGGIDMGYGLFGVNLFDVVDLEVDFVYGKMIFFKLDYCKNVVLVYWIKDGCYEVVDIELLVDE